MKRWHSDLPVVGQHSGVQGIWLADFATVVDAQAGSGDDAVRGVEEDLPERAGQVAGDGQAALSSGDSDRTDEPS
jgi:hypothetical protein